MLFQDDSGTLKLMAEDGRTVLGSFPHEGKVVGMAAAFGEMIYFATKHDDQCLVYAEKL